jgi:hypothetical protein
LDKLSKCRSCRPAFPFHQAEVEHQPRAAEVLRYQPSQCRLANAVSAIEPNDGFAGDFGQNIVHGRVPINDIGSERP